MSLPFDRDPPERPHRVSRLDLERHAAGEQLAPQLAHRIESDPQLRAEVASLRRLIEDFARNAPPLRKQLATGEESEPDPPRDVRQAAWLSEGRLVAFPRWLGVGFGLATAAAVLLFVFNPNLGGLVPGPNDIFLKGEAGPRFDVHVSEDGEPAARLEGPLQVRPGARLRFVLREAPGAGYVAVLSLEASGRVSRFVPIEGRQPTFVPGGGPTALDGTIEVDAYPGREWVIFVWAPKRFALSVVEAALAKLVETRLSEKPAEDIVERVRQVVRAPGMRVEARPLGRIP